MIDCKKSNNDVIENIKQKIQNILNRKFTEKCKRKIDVYHDRIEFACPICYDSRTDVRKKRGNIYLNSLHYHCFNCGEHMGVNYFLRSFDEELSPEDKMAIHDIQRHAKKYEKRSVSSQSSMSFTILNKLAIPKAILFKQLGLVSPYKNEFASNYLKSRMIDIRQWNKFAFNTSTKELYILNITPSDRVIGYQIRQLDKNSRKSRYLTTKLSTIYSDVFKKDFRDLVEKIVLGEKLGEKYIKEEDGVENISFNLDRLSGVFNIMNINTSQPITVTEGPIDSMAFENSIALQGASKQLNGFFDDMPNIRYLFDNDKIGKEMSIEKLKKHKKVFLWGMYLQNTENKKIKDVNDLQKSKLFNLEKIEQCFTDDEFDVMYV